MFKKICETSAEAPLGNPLTRRLMKVPDGEYSGRLMALIQTADNHIALTWADSPYSNWFSPSVVVSDAASGLFDTVMDASGNVWLVYLEQSTCFLVSRKLTFSDGSWTVGNRTYIYSGGFCVEPSVAIESSGKLWVSWAVMLAGLIDIHVKSSDDGGLTWGTGPSDEGDVVDDDLSAGHSRVTLTPGAVNVIYSGTDLMICSRPRTIGGEWTPAATIASGSGFDEHFDVAVSESGLVGVVFDSGQLRYREFDGSNWGAVTILDESEAFWPQIIFSGSAPVITYLVSLADGQTLVKHVHRRTGVFSSPAILDVRAGFFGSVILYDSLSSSYADLTEAAADETGADVSHPSSGYLVKAVSDTIYVGMDSPFRLLTVSLSTPGVGGTVTYAYFDGSNWRNFVPAGGNFNLDTNQKSLLLWQDMAAVPQDWQAVAIDGTTRFWVRLDVTTAFTTAPVASRLTSVTNINALLCGR